MSTWAVSIVGTKEEKVINMLTAGIDAETNEAAIAIVRENFKKDYFDAKIISEAATEIRFFVVNSSD